MIPIKDDRNDHTKLLNIQTKVECIVQLKNAMLIKTIYIAMEMDIHFAKVQNQSN